MTVLVVFMIVAGAVMHAQSQAQAPLAPQYDARWTLDNGQVYTGTMTFAVDAKGVVTGKMTLTSPATVNGPVGGAVKGDVWTFKTPFTVVEQNCSGTVSGTGKVPADRKVITGEATIEGCSDAPQRATFTLTRLEKK